MRISKFNNVNNKKIGIEEYVIDSIVTKRNNSNMSRMIYSVIVITIIIIIVMILVKIAIDDL